MKPIELAQAALQTIGATMTEEKTQLVINATSRGVFQLWQNGNALKAREFSQSAEHIENALEEKDRNGGFTGATASAVRRAFSGEFDTKLFRRAQEKVKGLITVPTLETLAGKRRTRYLSEYDGEYDFDRQYDLAPFSATRIENAGCIRVIDIDVEFSFNWRVSADSIAEYGALAWAIVDLVERAGIQANLRLAIPVTCDGPVIEKDAPHSKPTNIVQYIELKKAGEYIETMTLARCFTSFFFRRCIFAATCVFETARGRDTSHGLSYPNNKPSHASIGKLYIGSEAVNGGEYQIKAIGEFLKTALGLSVDDHEVKS